MVTTFSNVKYDRHFEADGAVYHRTNGTKKDANGPYNAINITTKARRYFYRDYTVSVRSAGACYVPPSTENNDA